ncbi:Protein of unknown function [Pyronema omphalodes CBS 100304]|uniref:Uncharacterized protein n=1 Tax=Pyronema omphalodes (strain CBS 100304) TaxID=1076935 RepID=U4LWP6_PYROM|nr:Protein of unknown function [Pyronema omphalodes CBS 100304]
MHFNCQFLSLDRDLSVRSQTTPRLMRMLQIFETQQGFCGNEEVFKSLVAFQEQYRSIYEQVVRSVPKIVETPNLKGDQTGQQLHMKVSNSSDGSVIEEEISKRFAICTIDDCLGTLTEGEGDAENLDNLSDLENMSAISLKESRPISATNLEDPFIDDTPHNLEATRISKLPRRSPVPPELPPHKIPQGPRIQIGAAKPVVSHQVTNQESNNSLRFRYKSQAAVVVDTTKIPTENNKAIKKISISNEQLLSKALPKIPNEQIKPINKQLLNEVNETKAVSQLKMQKKLPPPTGPAQLRAASAPVKQTRASMLRAKVNTSKESLRASSAPTTTPTAGLTAPTAANTAKKPLSTRRVSPLIPVANRVMSPSPARKMLTNGFEGDDPFESKPVQRPVSKLPSKMAPQSGAKTSVKAAVQDVAGASTTASAEAAAKDMAKAVEKVEVVDMMMATEKVPARMPSTKPAPLQALHNPKIRRSIISSGLNSSDIWGTQQSQMSQHSEVSISSSLLSTPGKWAIRVDTANAAMLRDFTGGSQESILRKINGSSPVQDHEQEDEDKERPQSIHPQELSPVHNRPYKAKGGRGRKGSNATKGNATNGMDLKAVDQKLKAISKADAQLKKNGDKVETKETRKYYSTEDLLEAQAVVLSSSSSDSSNSSDLSSSCDDDDADVPIINPGVEAAQSKVTGRHSTRTDPRKAAANIPNVANVADKPPQVKINRMNSSSTRVSPECANFNSIRAVRLQRTQGDGSIASGSSSRNVSASTRNISASTRATSNGTGVGGRNISGTGARNISGPTARNYNKAATRIPSANRNINTTTSTARKVSGPAIRIPSHKPPSGGLVSRSNTPRAVPRKVSTARPPKRSPTSETPSKIGHVRGGQQLMPPSELHGSIINRPSPLANRAGNTRSPVTAAASAQQAQQGGTIRGRGAQGAMRAAQAGSKAATPGRFAGKPKVIDIRKRDEKENQPSNQLQRQEQRQGSNQHLAPSPHPQPGHHSVRIPGLPGQHGVTMTLQSPTATSTSALPLTDLTPAAGKNPRASGHKKSWLSLKLHNKDFKENVRPSPPGHKKASHSTPDALFVHSGSKKKGLGIKDWFSGNRKDARNSSSSHFSDILRFGKYHKGAGGKDKGAGKGDRHCSMPILGCQFGHGKGEHQEGCVESMSRGVAGMDGMATMGGMGLEAFTQDQIDALQAQLRTQQSPHSPGVQRDSGGMQTLIGRYYQSTPNLLFGHGKGKNKSKSNLLGGQASSTSTHARSAVNLTTHNLDLDNTPTRAQQQQNPIFVAMEMITAARMEKDEKHREKMLGLCGLLVEVVTRGFEVEKRAVEVRRLAEEVEAVRELVSGLVREVVRGVGGN